MKKELEIAKLKAFCEEMGLDCQAIEDGILITKKKDHWERVEFVIPNHNSPCVKKPLKVVSIDNGFVQVYCPYSGYGNLTQLQKNEVNPSTEQAYVEQLKKTAFEKFGEIKEGDRFIEPYSTDKRNTVQVSGHGWGYMKEHDILYFENVYLYKQGKWAERVKERVKVKNYSYRTLKGNNPEIYHECTFKCSIKEFDDDVQIFLASQLEKYLNGEIE